MQSIFYYTFSAYNRKRLFFPRLILKINFIIFLLFLFNVDIVKAERHPYWVNKFSMEGIHKSLQSFYLDMRHFPSSKENLDSLFFFDKTHSHWNGPYLTDKYHIVDFWLNDFVYIAPDAISSFFEIKDSKVVYAIYSIGENGVNENGKGDDLVFFCLLSDEKLSDISCSMKENFTIEDL